MADQIPSLAVGGSPESGNMLIEHTAMTRCQRFFEHERTIKVVLRTLPDAAVWWFLRAPGVDLFLENKLDQKGQSD